MGMVMGMVMRMSGMGIGMETNTEPALDFGSTEARAKGNVYRP